MGKLVPGYQVSKAQGPREGGPHGGYRVWLTVCRQLHSRWQQRGKTMCKTSPAINEETKPDAKIGENDDCYSQQCLPVLLRSKLRLTRQQKSAGRIF